MYKVLMMAFAKGQESKEVVIHRYIGVAPVTILAVNPTKAELEKIYGSQLDKAPEYLGETTINEEKFPQVRIDFLVRTDAEKCNGIDMQSKLSFFLARTPDYNKDKTKVRVINKYGEDAWLPVEHAQAGTTPDNMSWYSMDGARIAYRGERDLTDFLKNFLVIPGRTYTDRQSGEKKVIPNLADAEAQLGQVEAYFKGDFTEIRDIIASQPTNKVKLCFGVKTTDDNKLYQDVFTRKTLRLRVTDYSRLDEEIQNAKANGSYPNTEFSVEPLHEYTVAATQFSQPDPAGAPAQPAGGWYN